MITLYYYTYGVYIIWGASYKASRCASWSTPSPNPPHARADHRNANKFSLPSLTPALLCSALMTYTRCVASCKAWYFSHDAPSPPIRSSQKCPDRKGWTVVGILNSVVLFRWCRVNVIAYFVLLSPKHGTHVRYKAFGDAWCTPFPSPIRVL